MDFISSETYKNIMHAFAGELMAAAKYSLFAEKAYQDGLVQIGDMFSETAGNEKEHAEAFMKCLNDGSIHGTLDNLKEACLGESNEWQQVYKDFADTAVNEGFEDIAELFNNIASIEKHHDYRFKCLAENLEKEECFKSDEESLWICLSCGYLHEGTSAPDVCPVCKKNQGYYKLNCEDY